MDEREVETDEARRAAGYGALKADVQSAVAGEIAERAAQPLAAEPARIALAAEQLRAKAVDEVVGTGRQVSVARGTARVSQVVDYLFFVVYGLLSLRFLLALVAARSSAGFVRALVAITDPFYAPFRGIVASSDLGTGHVVVLSFVVALVVYLAGHLAVHAMLRLIGRPRTTV